ncbi:WD repeat-containing protein 17-like, partial [Seriola dumerili]|uniref:WD repeat-containing protein 17-like n=1 Tax=Seriola dumerili TaxID=41447 RepID=UPI000BBECDD8
MAKVKQVGLLAAGCQPWNKDVCAASGDRFAYCATLAIYIYQLDQQYNEFKLRSIMSEHKKTITAISWCPDNPDLFASASADNLLIVWNVAEQKAVARLDNTKGVPASVSWCWNSADGVAFVSQRGPLYIWVYGGPDPGLTVHKEAHSFLSDICLFRWHPTKKGKLVFGHTDGSLSVFQPGSKSQKHVLRPESLEGTDEEDPVSALEWDPLSTDYLLVSNLHNGIRLVDSEALNCITSFCFPSAAASVQCLAWVPSAPGMFITGDSQVGVLRVWNVSRSTPLDSFKLKKTGFHALHVLNSPLSKKAPSSSSPSKSQHTSSTSEAVPPPTLSQNRSFSLPPGHAVCCFMDGGVGLYDMGAKKWDFLRDLGHVETIFDCKFKPDDPNLLATASFDGTIKIWDTNTLTAVYTSPGNEGVVYSLSWAPGDLNCIAGATSRSGAFIWDVRKGKIITRFNEHGKNGIFCISWSHKDSKRIATCSGDGFCIIRTIDGKILHKYKHPAAVFGCDWSQNNKDMIATGCEDKNVRVYYLATSSDQPLKVFTGHLAKVFHVRWSPLREGILCSGSDDGTVRIWDYTQDACINVLSGHTAPVRGLMWNTEVPYLLISGSWDYTIRVWDTRDGTCLDTAYDHGADVYGLTCHHNRPFTMASCSRDSTVRLWSLTPLISPLLLNILTDQPWEKIIGNTDTAMVPGSPPLLCGKVSRDVKQELDKLSSDIRAKKLRWFSECFLPPGGSSNLWDLVSVINGQDDSLLPASYSKGVMHMKHLLKFKTAQAQQLLNMERSPGPHVDNTLVSSGLTGAGDQDCKLPIVPVQVKSKKGTKTVITYAFLDQVSTAVFCTESLMHKLHLTGRNGRILLRTMGQEKVVSSNIVSGLEVAALEGDNFLELPRVYTQESMPVNRGNIPTERDIEQWSHLKHIRLPQIDAGIELLIGTNVPKALEPLEVVCSVNDGPYAIRTLLGWTVNGPLTGSSGETVKWEHPQITVNRVAVVNLDDLWQQQFKNDFPESSIEEQPGMSREDQRFLEFVNNTVKQVEEHYQIALPLRNRDVSMPNNRRVVEQRLCYLKRRFQKDSIFHTEYNTFINDLLAKGYAEKVPEEELDRGDGKVWYIPHHGVYHPTKRKIRAVFDCGARYQGTSLNAQLLQGPDLTSSLIGVVTRFRKKSVVIMADIESMFHQVQVPPDDRDLLRFLWWPKGDTQQLPIEHRMKVHLFGATSSPSCANFALRKCAEDHGHHY